MNRKNTISLFIESNARRYAILATVLFSLGLGTWADAQVDSVTLNETVDRDMAQSIPFQMEVTAINLKSGLIALNNENYSLVLFTEGTSTLEAPRLQASFDLESLRVGERVIVETDGTAPSDSHTPFITAIRRP